MSNLIGFFQSISPGAVETEILTPQLAESLKDCMLKSEDISAAVMYVLGTPPNVQVFVNICNEIMWRASDNFGNFVLQVHELMIKPMGEKFL